MKPIRVELIFNGVIAFAYALRMRSRPNGCGPTPATYRNKREQIDEDHAVAAPTNCHLVVAGSAVRQRTARSRIRDRFARRATRSRVTIRRQRGVRGLSLELAAAEYVAAQRYNADRANARTNLGSFEARRGEIARAEEDLKAAIALDPLFVPAYINLADTYRARGRDAEGGRVLRDGLRLSPKSAALHYALGLTLIREKRNVHALAELAKAAALEPASSRYAYVYGVALHSAGRADEAIAMLVDASTKHPADTDILGALANFYRDRGNEIEAQRYTERLRAVAAGL